VPHGRYGPGRAARASRAASSVNSRPVGDGCGRSDAATADRNAPRRGSAVPRSGSYPPNRVRGDATHQIGCGTVRGVRHSIRAQIDELRQLLNESDFIGVRDISAHDDEDDCLLGPLLTSSPRARTSTGWRHICGIKSRSTSARLPITSTLTDSPVQRSHGGATAPRRNPSLAEP
jgi:hypothetical protein